tara:strand:+ start:100 stop:630 length:531 start_codon:yes stop_codon:yes gene_type:complete
MKITTQQELSSLIATADEFNTIVLNEDLEITFDCTIPCHIYTKNIKAYNIKASDIKASNIKASNIKASSIDASNIKAEDIKTWNINADDIDASDIKTWNIKASNIKASNIDALNIDALNINYYAFCIAYRSLKCKSILGKRKNSFHKCLDQEIEIKKEKVTLKLTQDQLDKIKHLI